MLLVLVLLVSSVSACSPGGDDWPAGEETVRAYVAAINAGDGKAVCGLLTVPGAYELVDWMVEDDYADETDCPRIVSLLIGYGEEADTDTFRSARIVEVHRGEREDDVRSVPIRVEVERSEQGNDLNRRTETLHDVVWLVEEEGRILLARPSSLLYASFGAYTYPPGVFDAPDTAAQRRHYHRRTAAEERTRKNESRSFRTLGDRLFRCSGARTSQVDASRDLYIGGVGYLSATDALPYGAADIRRVEVEAEGDDLCARVTVRDGEIRELLTIGFEIYSPEKNPTNFSFSLNLQLEVRADGRARLGYEDYSREDEYGRHPFIPVSTELAREGDTFGFRVTRSALPDSTRLGSVPGWDGFLWGAMTHYKIELAGESRSVGDYLHDRNMAMTSHPGGKVFSLYERQERDLPTG